MCFEYTKQWLEHYEVTNNPLLKSFVGSMVGGAAISFMMTPFDLIMTRLYNQRKSIPSILNISDSIFVFNWLPAVEASGKGVLYSGYLDCVSKIFKSEGLTAFFKGIGPMYLRLGPHTVLCLMFFDHLRSVAYKYFPPQSHKLH